MAFLTGINTRLSGSVGDWTFSQVHGKTVAKQKVAPKAEPVRTVATQSRRIQWANLVNVWRAFEGSLHPSFENRPAGVSDFNEFISSNIGIVPVYLEKDEARQGGAVAAPYQITRGSMPSVTATISTGDNPSVSTDIILGSFTPGSTTTIGDFSRAVISNNADYQDGDQITYFEALQSVNATNGAPYLKINAKEITLDLGDSTDFPSGESGFHVVSGHLGSESMVNGAVAWVHSRRTTSGTKVSTQRFTAANTILASYQTAAKKWDAIESYGGVRDEQFLTPHIDTEEPIES